MISFRAACIVALLSTFLISCGDTFRPIAIPQTVTPPGGETQKTAIVISSDATQSYETNVSMAGGTVTGSATLGQGAVHAALFSGRVITANADAGTLTAALASAPQSSSPTTITLPSGSRPVFVLPVGSNIFVAFNGTGQVGVVNGTTLTFSTAIDLGGTGKAPVALAASADGKKVYVANSGDGTVGVIDTTSLALTTTVSFSGPACAAPAWLTTNPRANLVYVVCSDSNSVQMIDTTIDSRVGVVGVGSTPVYSIFDVLKQRLVVANSGSASVSFVNEDPAAGASLHSVTTTAVSGNPSWLTLLPDGTRVYVSSPSGDVTVINNSTLAVKTTIAVGGTPKFIATSSDSLRVAVTPTAGPGANNLSSISTGTEAVTSQVPVPGTSTYLLVNP